MGEIKITSSLIISCFITCFGSSFLIGYNLGVPNIPEPEIKRFLVQNFIKISPKSAKFKDAIESNSAALLLAVVNAIYVIGAAIGAFICGIISDLMGRRNSLILNNIFAIIGALLITPLVFVSQPIFLYMGRFVLGFNNGISMGVASMYLVEMAPKNLRGIIGGCNQLAITVGIAIAYTFSQTRLVKITRWPIIMGLVIIPAIISLIVLPFCPESPRYLYVNKGNKEKAEAAFLRLNKSESVDTLIKEITEEIESAKDQPKFAFTNLFTNKELRLPFILACLIQVLQQLSGINAVITYSSIMFEEAGIPKSMNDICVLLIGIINVVVTIGALPLLERAGRRPLLLWPTVLVAVSLILLCIAVPVASKGPKNVQNIFATIAVILIFIYIIGFAAGLGPMPTLLVAEIFRQGPRAAAVSISQGIQWSCNLIVQLSFPVLMKLLGGFVFLPFAAVVIICFVFFYMYMPETKNRTFDEIARDVATWKIATKKEAE